MNDLISVIVTVYNREEFLDECLTSLKNQTYKNFEAIIVDDGSTDKSLIVAQKYQDEDSRFKVIHSEHIGFPAAKNLGLKNVSGKYIIFLDSDDSAYPYWLDFLYKPLIQSGADISTCYYDEYAEEKAAEHDLKFFNENPVYLEEFSFLKMNLLYHRNCSSYMWNKLIKKELFDGIVFKDQMALSDISEMYKIFDKANKVIQVKIPLIHYRRHLQSMGAESASKGLEYYKFRASVIKESTAFIWSKYPQSRFALQKVLKSELGGMVKVLGKEVFEKHIYCKQFHYMLNMPSVKYLFKD